MPKILVVDKTNKSFELESDGYEYFIPSVEVWNTIANPKESFIITNYPSGTIKTPIDKKFLYNQTYKLVDDLDFTDSIILSWNNFTGVFNGNNKTISNIYSEMDEFTGLFGFSNHCIIKNVCINNFHIFNNNDNNSCIITNVNFCDLLNIKLTGEIHISGNNSAIVSAHMYGNVSDLNVKIKSNINNLFTFFNGQFKNSYVSIETDHNKELFSK